MCDRDDDVERKPDTDEGNHHDAEAIADAAGALEPNPAGDNTKDREAVNDGNILYMPTPRADAGGAGNHPPTHDADAAEQPEEGDGDGGNDGDNDDDFEDDETPDALDEAAACVKCDYERRTLPYVQPVDGAAMLDEIVAAINRFNAALPPGSAETIALWTVMTYALYPCGLRFAPRLMVRKPVSNAGGTNLVTVLLYLVRRPKYNSGITEANYLRQASKRRTIIVDECDGALKGNTKLVKMMLAGHGHQGIETRIIKNVPVDFKVFGPLITCGNGDYGPPTLHNRSFVLPVKRMMESEAADAFDPDLDAPALRTIREKIMRWVEDHVDAIRECRPQLDRALALNRQRDNILTLLKIADTVGGEWSQRAREALTALTARDRPLDENEMLIGDIAEILLDPTVMVGDPPQRIGADRGFVFSADLCELLKQRFPHRGLYETGWGQAKLASMLRTFDIFTDGQRRKGQVLRAYRRADFDDLIARYAPDVVAAYAEEPSEPESAATVLQEVPEREAAGSTVAAIEGAKTAMAAAPEPRTTEPATAEIVYPNAHVVEPGKGDKKRADALRRAVDAYVQAGKVEAERVRFISGRFWVIERQNSAPFYGHLDDHGELELLRIEAPGLVAEKDATNIRVNPGTVLRLAETDFMIVRPLVNKYRKLSAR
jgi:hypothetical protein